MRRGEAECAPPLPSVSRLSAAVRLFFPLSLSPFPSSPRRERDAHGAESISAARFREMMLNLVGGLGGGGGG